MKTTLSAVAVAVAAAGVAHNEPNEEIENVREINENSTKHWQ